MLARLGTMEWQRGSSSSGAAKSVVLNVARAERQSVILSGSGWLSLFIHLKKEFFLLFITLETSYQWVADMRAHDGLTSDEPGGSALAQLFTRKSLFPP